MGNRFLGGIKPGAMPPLHKYLGNPVLIGIGRLLFPTPCGDFHCGLRGFRKDAIANLNLRTAGMEFASEMVVKDPLLLPCLVLAIIFWKSFSPYIQWYLVSGILNLSLHIVLTSRLDLVNVH